MSEPLFLADAYLTKATGKVVARTSEGGIVLDKSLFYATSGGQPGDSGLIVWQGCSLQISTAIKGDAGAIILVPSDTSALPSVGTEVVQQIDWARRHRHMRVHTALHLLSVAVPLPVTGGQISADKGRLDFDMPDAPDDIAALEARINEFIAKDLEVTQSWISEAELAANPGLVKTMSVAPPTGQGSVRLVRIGLGSAQIDLQPCGGTHVARTGEIGQVSIGKVENKGRQNRRIHLHLSN